MGDYAGATALPGATAAQDIAIEMALRMVDKPEAHDGLKRQLYALLGGEGFSDQQIVSRACPRADRRQRHLHPARSVSDSWLDLRHPPWRPARRRRPSAPARTIRARRHGYA